MMKPWTPTFATSNRVHNRVVTYSIRTYRQIILWLTAHAVDYGSQTWINPHLVTCSSHVYTLRHQGTLLPLQLPRELLGIFAFIIKQLLAWSFGLDVKTTMNKTCQILWLTYSGLTMLHKYGMCVFIKKIIYESVLGCFNVNMPS